MTIKRDTKAIIIIVVYVLALTISFSNKAYHIDDTAFLFIADQILKDPLRPYSFVVEWGDSTKPGTLLNDTPLGSYYIALISWLFGRSEIILHISYIIFPIIAGLSFYFIAKRFIYKPLIATLILVSTPTFLPNSHNLMFDVPVLSLFLLAIVLFIYGIDKENHKLLFFGGLAAGLAYLMKPTAVIVIPLLALYCFIKKKPKYIAYQIIPIIIIILFALHNYLFEDRILLLNYLSWVTGNKQSLKLLSAHFFSNLSYIGGATIFPFFLVWPFIKNKKNFVFMGISILIAAIVSILIYNLSSNFVSGRYTLFQLILFFFFTTSSTFFILAVLAENYKNIKLGMLKMLNITRSYYNTDAFFIFAWFIGIFIFNNWIVGGAVRWNTLFLPPLVLSYFLILKKYIINVNKFLLIILFLTAFIGVVVAYADYEYSNSYRNFAEAIPETYKTSSNIIHFLGGAGFQYYMTENGYRMLLNNDHTPKKGDIIIKARISFPRKMTPELMSRSELINVISFDGKIPVRIQNPEAHAGFYTYAGGFLPYSLSTSKLENFDIYYVKK